MSEDRDRLVDWPAPTMPVFSFHALHGYYVDALFDATHDLRSEVLNLAGGLSSGHLVLAINDGRFRVDVRIENECPWLWLSYRTPDGDMRPIVALTPDAIGADPVLVLREQELRLEDALRAIVGEHP